MRSRYAAFCQANIPYLIETHHPSQRQPNDAETLQKTIDETTWLGLKVIRSSQPKKAEQTGLVEFVAFYKNPINSPIIAQLHERSDFIRENGQWYYLQGQMLPPITLGRNDLCWCGSNKKYKKCHGR